MKIYKICSNNKEKGDKSAYGWETTKSYLKAYSLKAELKKTMTNVWILRVEAGYCPTCHKLTEKAELAGGECLGCEKIRGDAMLEMEGMSEEEKEENKELGG